MEVLGLHVRDVDIGGRWVTVTGKGSKQRRVPLDADVASVINVYLLAERPESDSDVLFLVGKGPRRGGPLTAAGWRTVFRYLRGLTGLDHKRLACRVVAEGSSTLDADGRVDGWFADADRRLAAALTEHPDNELAALTLRPQRACGLRIGELLDLELDCVHELDGNGAWLKVPVGKLATERVIPLDPETLEVIDRVSQTRPPADRSRIPATGGPPSSCSPTSSQAHTARRPLRTQLRQRERQARTRHLPPATTHLRNRAGQRRRLPASTHGTPRPPERGEEPRLYLNDIETSRVGR